MQKAWSGHAIKTHLTNPISGPSDGTFAVASTTGFPVSANPFILTVDYGSAATEEKILCASFSGLTVTVATGGRGWDGTAAQGHAVGVDGQVVHTIDAATVNDHDVFVHAVGTSAPIASAVGAAVANGGSGVPADSAHVHGRESFGTDVTTNTVGQATANGTGTTVAHSNHAHATPAVAPPSRTGEVVAFGGVTAPANSLLCDGSAVSRTGATAALFAILGTTYGAGDGSTTFNVPDLRGRSPSGAMSSIAFGTLQPYQLLGSSGGSVLAYTDASSAGVNSPGASVGNSIGARNPYTTVNFIIYTA